MARRDPLLGLLLALFGLVALGAAMLAIINATGGRVLVQRADLGMLQTLGFTPGQVMMMLVAEHAALGVGRPGGRAGRRAAARSRAAGRGARRQRRLPPRCPLGWSLLIVGGIEAAVILATAVPGWRAGRVWPVAAVRPVPPQRPPVAAGPRRDGVPAAAGRSCWARAPPSCAGCRPLLTIGGLAVPMIMITIGLGFWSTLDEVQRDPADIGLAAGADRQPRHAEPRRGPGSWSTATPTSPPPTASCR